MGRDRTLGEKNGPLSKGTGSCPVSPRQRQGGEPRGEPCLFGIKRYSGLVLGGPSFEERAELRYSPAERLASLER